MISGGFAEYKWERYEGAFMLCRGKKIQNGPGKESNGRIGNSGRICL